MAFEDILEKVGDLAQAGAAKAKEIAEIAKLRVNNAAEEDTIRKAYLALGKKYYADRVMAPDPQYAVLCAKITASKEKIEANNQRIADIKAAADLRDDDIPGEEAPAAEAAAAAAGEEPPCAE